MENVPTSIPKCIDLRTRKLQSFLKSRNIIHQPINETNSPIQNIDFRMHLISTPSPRHSSQSLPKLTDEDTVICINVKTRTASKKKVSEVSLLTPCSKGTFSSFCSFSTKAALSNSISLKTSFAKDDYFTTEQDRSVPDSLTASIFKRLPSTKQHTIKLHKSTAPKASKPKDRLSSQFGKLSSLHTRISDSEETKSLVNVIADNHTRHIQRSTGIKCFATRSRQNTNPSFKVNQPLLSGTKTEEETSGKMFRLSFNHSAPPVKVERVKVSKSREIPLRVWRGKFGILANTPKF